MTKCKHERLRVVDTVPAQVFCIDCDELMDEGIDTHDKEVERHQFAFMITDENNQPTVAVRLDGSVMVSPDIQLDVAAREFWEAVHFAARHLAGERKCIACGSPLGVRLS